MADYVDDFYNKMKRSSTRSFFPAANNALATGVRSTPYGGGSGNYGFGPNSGLVSPENNPAYQAAISRPRLQRDQLQTVQIPGSGSVTLPIGSRLPSQFTSNPASAYSTGRFSGLGNVTPNSGSSFNATSPGQFNVAPNENMVANPVSPNLYNPAPNESMIASGTNTYRQPSLSNQPPGERMFPNAIPQNSALATVQNFQQSGQFNLQPTQPRRYFDPASNYNF